MSLSKTQIFLFFESGNYVKATRRLPQASNISCLHRFIIIFINGAIYIIILKLRIETYQYPSRKAMKKMKAEVKRNVNRRSLLVAKEEDLIKNLNPKITGWKNYYSTKRNEKWMKALDWYIICTFTRWYNKKHQRRNHMSKVGFVRNSIYGKGLKKMARA